MPVANQVSVKDLQQLAEICDKVSYHLTAFLAATAAGNVDGLPPDVAQVYKLAAQLPVPTPQDWAALAGKGPPPKPAPAAPAAATAPPPLAEGAARAPGKRLKWTAELEAELMKLVEDDDFRTAKLGKDGQRGGALNWAGVARHFGYSSGSAVRNKYNELKGIPKPEGTGKKKKAEGEGEGDAGAAAEAEKPPAKKAKTGEGSGKKAKEPRAAAPVPPPAPAPAAPTPATTGASGGDWTKQRDAELVKLVESEAERKKAFGKRKLKWKSIAKHFGVHRKDCRKRYTKATNKPAPEDDE